MRYFKGYFLVLVGLAAALFSGGWLFFTTVGERENPAIKFAEDLIAIGHQKTINIHFSDLQSGLRQVSVAIVQDNKSQVVASQAFPQKGIQQKAISLTVSPAALKLHDGPAVVSVTAVDYSLFKNETVINRPVTIDRTAPQIYLLTPTNNINPGGCGVIAYRTSKPAAMSGVMVNKNFVPAYPAMINSKPTYVAYFALPIGFREAGASLRVLARDGGDNEASIAVPMLLRNKKFRNDKMNLTDGFLNRIAADFQPMPPEMQGRSPLEIFTYINATLRLANEATIREACRQSVPQQLWEGTFLRMKNASPMAQFGDQRTYLYDKKAIGSSVHLGVDLASTANAPVEASNNGIVKFTGNLGLYGNAIIVDHGQGIFSVYGHMSEIGVKLGQHLKKGDIMGKTGRTGFAMGDHLHFSGCLSFAL